MNCCAASVMTTPLNIRGWWARHNKTVWRIVVPVLGACAFLNLTQKFYLTVEAVPTAAHDVMVFYDEVHGWFAGKPIYSELKYVDYPPASYLLLWPLVGWSNPAGVRLFWAASVLAMLLWLSYFAVRESGAETRLERAFVALLPLSMNAAGFTLRIGQVSAHVIAMLLASLLWRTGFQDRWQDDIGSSIFMTAALVKPSLSVPFFWILLFVRRTLRPATLVVAGYVALTAIALSFQSFTLGNLLGWLKWGVSNIDQGYAHLSLLLWSVGLAAWALPAAFLVLAILGVWVYHYRAVDRWLLLGVTALVARLWTYHMGYDDLLILLPMVALFRVTRQAPSDTDGKDVVAGLLLAVTVVVMLVPNKIHVMARLGRLSLPLHWFITWINVLVWLAVLVFLVYVAGSQLRERHLQQR